MAAIASPHLLIRPKQVHLAFAVSSCCSVPKDFGDSQFFHRNRNVALTHKRNSTVLPKIRAQNSHGSNARTIHHYL